MKQNKFYLFALCGLLSFYGCKKEELSPDIFPAKAKSAGLSACEPDFRISSFDMYGNPDLTTYELYVIQSGQPVLVGSGNTAPGVPFMADVVDDLSPGCMEYPLKLGVTYYLIPRVGVGYVRTFNREYLAFSFTNAAHGRLEVKFYDRAFNTASNFEIVVKGANIIATAGSGFRIPPLAP
jgi:hypothetical protein